MTLTKLLNILLAVTVLGFIFLIGMTLNLGYRVDQQNEYLSQQIDKINKEIDQEMSK